MVFPVIDIMRIAVKNETNNKAISTHEAGIVMEKLKTILDQKHTVVNNKLVSLRFICNLLLHPFGEELVFSNRVELLEQIASVEASNKNVQTALATVLLNMSIVCIKKNDEIGLEILASILPELLTNFQEAEAQFRGYVALGTLMSSPKYGGIVKERIRNNQAFLSALEVAVTTFGSDAEQKRKHCACQVQKTLLK